MKIDYAGENHKMGSDELYTGQQFAAPQIKLGFLFLQTSNRHTDTGS